MLMTHMEFIAFLTECGVRRRAAEGAWAMFGKSLSQLTIEEFAGAMGAAVRAVLVGRSS